MNKLEKSDDDFLEMIIEEINSTIFSKKEWIENSFYKIPEVTYSYETFNWKGPFVNLTIFCDIGEMNIAEFKKSSYEKREILIKESSQKIIDKVTLKKEKILLYLNKIRGLDSNGDKILENKRKIIIGGLEENLQLLNLSIIGLPIEEEKALIGLYFNDSKSDNKGLLEEKEREYIRKNIETINTEVFGEKLSDNQEYVEGIIDYYHSKYESYKKKIIEKDEDKLSEDGKKRIMSEQEELRYKLYLGKLQELSPDYNGKIRDKPKKAIDKEWDEIKIHKTDLLKQFNNHFTAIDKHTGNMPQRAKFDDKVGSITDTPEGILYPNNVDEFNFLTLSRVAKLLGHEIEQHGVSLVSHETLVGNIRGEKNLELAEGAAKLNEDLFEYGQNLLIDGVDNQGNTVKIIDIEKLQYVSNFPKTLMEEILTNEEFLDFLELNNKVEPDKTSPLQRYLRHKRTGFQRKDITYTTGKIKAAKYYNDIITGVNDSGKFSDLFIAKVGFNQLSEARELKKNVRKKNKEIKKYNKKISLENKDKNDITKKKMIKLPKNLMFHEVLYFSIKQREKRKRNEVNAFKFYQYMQAKYPFMDYTMEKIESIRFGFKVQLLSAVKLTESAIITHNTSKQAEKILNRK